MRQLQELEGSLSAPDVPVLPSWSTTLTQSNLPQVLLGVGK